MNELRRLLAGIMSSIMVLSLILMPIPNVNIVYAADDTTDPDCDNSIPDKKTEPEAYQKYVDQKGGIYKAGCELNAAQTQATLDNHLKSEDKWKGIIEQAVVAMMGVVLMDNLFYKYLYAYDNQTYGNDCASNTAAKFTIRGAQLASLAYIIGDVQANTKFKEISKAATDEPFAAKAKDAIPDSDSDEVAQAKEDGKVDPRIKAFRNNNKQIQSYDALLKNLYAQKDAVETKLKLTIVSEVAYTAVEVIELLNIVKCKAECTTTFATAAAKEAVATASFSAALAEITTKNALNAVGLAGGGLPQGCAELLKLAGEKAADVVAEEASNKVSGEKEAKKKSLKDKIKNTKYFAWLAGVVGMLKSNEVMDKNVSEVSTASAEDILQDETDGMTTSTADSTNGQTRGTATMTDATDLLRLVQTCESVGDTQKAIIEAEVNILKSNTYTQAAGKAMDRIQLQPVKAGNEMNESVKKLVDQAMSDYFDFKYARASCCGGAGISMVSARVIKQSLQSASNTLSSDYPNAYQKLNDIYADMVQIETDYAAGQTVDSTAEDGTFLWQGITADSVMAKVADTKAVNPLKKSGLLNQRPREGFSLDYVLPIVVENELYKYGMKNEVDWDSRDSKLINKQIADLGRRIELASKEVKQQIVKSLYPAGPVLASDDDKMKHFMGGIRTILSNFSPVPKAEAISTGGATGMIVGAGLGMLANELDGPWAEVMNVGSKYMMLHSLLNMLGRGELFHKPRSRALTWAAMIILNGFVIAFDKKAIDEIQKQIEVVEIERVRYINSAAARTSVSGDGGRAGLGKLNLQKYDFSKAALSQKNIVACAAPKGDSIAPVLCPSLLPMSSVSLPEVSSRLRNHLSPEHMKGLSMFSSSLYGSASGTSYGGDNLSASDLAAMQSTSNALKIKAASLRSKIDNQEANSNIPNKFKSAPLNAMVAGFKRSFSSAGGGGGSPLGAIDSGFGGRGYNRADSVKKGAVASYKRPSVSEAVGGEGLVTAPKSTGFDLDFGDDDASAAGKNNAFGANGLSKKSIKNLNDFEFGHNDISKKKEVPIWKILSNRYILSYPRILEEDGPKAQADTKKSKKKVK